MKVNHEPAHAFFLSPRRLCVFDVGSEGLLFSQEVFFSDPCNPLNAP